MEETQETAAANAAATRKRRSSILKSQRPPRTPFCELEFNVCTPTDTSKSRRVSFSRRTGVAEFVTNEATTTWKNFYEEHNKSLESSGNDSAGNGTKQTIGHLGKRLFDQQFEEVEAVDLFAGPVPALNISTTINTVNFTIDCTDKLTAPQNNYELSAFAEQRSKVFGDDLTVPCLGEVSDRINVDFSAIQQIGEKDDLDEIQQDVQLQSRAPCQGSFNGRRSLSEYVEVDLNTTYFGMQQQESDMSITDIIQSPKVQDVSKSVSIDKKVKVCQDWAADKENIAFNPYVAPRESLNFAINEEEDKVLVFDGKRLIVETEKSNKHHSSFDNHSQKEPQRKTIVLNRSDDDLPNFDDIAPAEMVGGSKLQPMKISDILSNRDELDKSRVKHSTILYDDDLCDISIINVVSNVVENKNKEKTIVYEDHACEISMTQALPPNIISENTTNKRKTIIYEECAGNVSITQAIPNTIQEGTGQDNRRSVIYENTASNISITKAIPTKIMDYEKAVLSERRKTVVFDSEDGNMSATQAIPTNIIMPQKVNLQAVDKENINKSTQPNENKNLTDDIKPLQNIIESNKRRTIVFENEDADISMTQAVNLNQLLPGSLKQEVNEEFTEKPSGIDDTALIKRRTILCEGNDADISVTQAVPNLLLEIKNDCDSGLNSNNKRRTVVFDNDDADISMTQAVNLNQVLPDFLGDNLPSKIEEYTNSAVRNDATENKRRTIVYEKDDADISMTQAVNLNQILPGKISDYLPLLNKDVEENTNSAAHNDATANKRRTIVYEKDDADISMTQAVHSNQVLPAKLRDHLPSLKKDVEENTNSAAHNDATANKRRTIVYDKDDADISMTQAIPNNLMLPKEEKRKTIVFDDINMSTTSAVPAHIVAENQHLFMEIDKITNNELSRYKPIVESKYNVDGLDVSMRDASVAEQELPRVRNNEKSILEVMSHKDTVVRDMTHDAIILDETTRATKSKPIPGKISMLRDEFNKSLLENIKLTEDSLISNVVSDIVVYQAVAVNSQNQPASETDERDCPTQELVSEEGEKYSERLTQDNLPVTNSEQTKYGRQTSQNEGLTREEVNAEKIDEPKLSTTSAKLNDSTNRRRTGNKKSILHELLNMSDSSVVGVPLENSIVAGTVEKNVTIKTESKHSILSTDKPATASTSNDTLFYILRDSDDENEEDAKELSKTSDPSPLQHQQETEPEIVADLQSKPIQLNTSLGDDQTTRNRHYEKVCSPDTEKQELNKTKTSSFSQGCKSFKLANDTNELLDMLSDFTDKRKSIKNLDPHLEEDEEKPEPVLVKEHLALENKCDSTEAAFRRLSCLPRRQSIVLSREDLLNNMSMAAAVLQKSRYELEESDNSMEETDVNIDSPDPEQSIKKSVRLSNDIVKTLNFDEDSVSDGNISGEAKSPLKKTAFGEVSYMKDTKTKVIPEFLKDVSDGVKELMDDLVKPMADVLPFESVGVDSLKKAPSTCSTQIQANLVTSSQIDINTGLYSDPEDFEMNKVSSIDIINDAVNKSFANALKSPRKSNVSPHTNKSLKMDVSFEDQKMPVRNVRYSNPNETEPIIIFDVDNPLNNVVLAAPVNIEAHKYNPEPSTEESKNVSPNISVNEIDRDRGLGRVSAQYHVESNLKPCAEDKSDSYSVTSKSSKPVSIDQSTEAVKNDVVDTEVNTIIAMKANKELLEASSSLTLVDDALPRTTNVKIESADTEEKQERPHSPVKVIYKLDENCPMKLDSDFTSNDEMEETMIKSKKRMYSPTKRDNRANLSTSEVTPKPASKMQKLSRSPDCNTEEPTDNTESDQSNERIQTEKKSPKKSKARKPGTSVTVQQLMAEYNVVNIDEDGLRSKIKEVLANPESDSCSVNTESGAVSSCSSKNMRHDSIVSQSTSNSSRMEWQADIDEQASKELEGCDSGVNIVAKIDMLPFMGRPECEWECSSGDTWSFRLLHARLRLAVTLSHTHRNAARTAVRADTRLARLALHTLRSDEKNPIIHLCVEYAAERIRWDIARLSQQHATARSVPALLTRAAAAARLAARWARALARLAARTACTLTRDGLVTLKVANIPLRSVWQVTAQLELASGPHGPWPRAANVRVTSVLAECSPSAAEVARALAHTPHDWGHAPNTIRKIFKYLKHKTRHEGISIGV